MIERKLLSNNLITVIGTLVNTDIKTATSQAGKDYVRGKASIKVNDVTIELNFFTMKMTKGGAVSKLYNTYCSLGELKGRRVEVTGYIDEAKVPTNGVIHKGNSLYLRFINVLSDTDTRADSATFEISGFIQEGLKAVYAEDGATVKDYVLVLGQADYNNTKAKTFRLNVDKTNTAAIDSINNKFTVGVTATFTGTLDFDVETRVTTIEQSFGPALTKTTQRSVKRYVVTSGNLVIDDAAYTQDEIKILLAGTAEDDALQLKNNGGANTQPAVNIRPGVQPRLI